MAAHQKPVVACAFLAEHGFEVTSPQSFSSALERPREHV